jgi:hypothetical protein
MVGGNQPDLRASLSGKLRLGRARMGTPRKRSTAPSAMPSLVSKSISTLRMRSCQSGSSPVPSGQLVYDAWAARERALPRKSMRSARPLVPMRRNSKVGDRK